MTELTDADLDQIHGGAGTGVGTAATAQGGGLDAPVFNAFPAIVQASAETGITPVGHGTITASSAQG